MRRSVRRVNAWLLARPTRGLLSLVVGAALGYGCYRWGRVLLAPTEGLPANQRSLFGRYVAWPGGTWTPFATGAVVLWLLVVPGGRLEGKWRRLAALVAWWATLAFVVLQLLDDHLLDQAGTSNPSGLEIPYPFQDLLELPLIALLALVFLGALVALPVRLPRRRAPR